MTPADARALKLGDRVTSEFYGDGEVVSTVEGTTHDGFSVLHQKGSSRESVRFYEVSDTWRLESLTKVEAES